MLQTTLSAAEVLSSLLKPKKAEAKDNSGWVWLGISFIVFGFLVFLGTPDWIFQHDPGSSRKLELDLDRRINTTVVVCQRNTFCTHSAVHEFPALREEGSVSSPRLVPPRSRFLVLLRRLQERGRAARSGRAQACLRLRSAIDSTARVILHPTRAYTISALPSNIQQ